MNKCGKETLPGGNTGTAMRPARRHAKNAVMYCKHGSNTSKTRSPFTIFDLARAKLCKSNYEQNTVSEGKDVLGMATKQISSKFPRLDVNFL